MQILTHISRGSAGCRHHTPRVFDLGQPKVTYHDFGVLLQAVVQQVLWLQMLKQGEQHITHRIKVNCSDMGLTLGKGLQVLVVRLSPSK